MAAASRIIWLRRNPLVPGALGMWLGLVAHRQEGGLPAVLALLLLLVPATAWMVWRGSRAWIPACVVCAVGLLGGWWRGADGQRSRPAQALPIEGMFLEESGRVGRVGWPPPGSGLRPWFSFAPVSGRWNGLEFKIILPENAPAPLPGSLVHARGSFRLPAPPRNPLEWDESAHFADRGLAGKIRQRQDRPVEILRSPPWWHPLAWGERGRRWLADSLSCGIDDADRRAVVLGIALGLMDGMGDTALLAFRRTGSLHLFSVSGMHVGMLVSLLWLALHPLAWPRNRLAWIVLPVVLAYALVTGWEAPAVRAAIMTSTVLAGLAMDRTPRLLNSLAAAFILLLGFAPGQLYDLGFQLTFSVVLAIVVLGLPLARKLSFIGQPDPFLPPELVSPGQRNLARSARFACTSLAFGVAANIGSLPLSVLHFNLLTPSGVLLGLLLVPLAWLILAGSVLAVVPAALGLTGVCTAIGKLLGLLALACIQLCGWGASLPGAWIAPSRPPAARTEAIVFDLDKGGSSMLVRTGGTAVMLDTGNPGHARRITGRACTQLGAVPLDLLVLTHGDAQHRGGREELELATAPPRAVLESADAPMPALPAGTSCDLLFPPPGWKAPRADDRALVTRWGWSGWRLLWLGDAGFTAQKWMLAHLPDGTLACDVLCVGWHAGDIGLLREFVLQAKPRLVIWHRWRAETLNPPGEELRRFLADQGIPLLEQSATGAITLRMGTDRLEAIPFLAPDRTITLHQPGDADGSPGSSSPAPANAPQNP